MVPRHGGAAGHAAVQNVGSLDRPPGEDEGLPKGQIVQRLSQHSLAVDERNEDGARTGLKVAHPTCIACGADATGFQRIQRMRALLGSVLADHPNKAPRWFLVEPGESGLNDLIANTLMAK